MSGIRAFAADALSLVDCKVGLNGLDLFQQVPRMLDQICMWGILTRSVPLALCHVLLAFSEQFLWFGRAHLLLGAPLLLRSAVAMGACTWSAVVFVWVVSVIWFPHECRTQGSQR